MAAHVDAAAPPTERLYLSYDGNFLLECAAVVVAVRRDDGDALALAFDVSVFHPQGGGQPSDTGAILNQRTGEMLAVARASYDFGTRVVTHWIAGVADVVVGDACELRVDGAARETFSRCHTAGHMVDSAMVRAGWNLPPTKGYHFLDGPYVESASGVFFPSRARPGRFAPDRYKGTVPADARAPLVARLQAEFAALVAEDIATTIATFPAAEADARLNRVQKNFDLSTFDDPTVRVVGVAGFECPCGGTHLRSTGLVDDYTVTGIRVKKGVVRIKYDRRPRAAPDAAASAAA